MPGTMIRLLSSLVLLLNTTIAFAQQDTFLLLDTRPRFQGGDRELMLFLYSNIKYPAAASDSIIEGVVYLSFVVEADGAVTNIKVLRDIGGGCGKEAKRVIGLMPKWEPGRLNGVPMRAKESLAVKFKHGIGVASVFFIANSVETNPNTLLEEAPGYSGGEDSMDVFLRGNLRYPTMAKESGIQGKVIVMFTIEADGTLSNADLVRDIGGGCGEEAKRAIRLMPKWNPGQIEGQAVAVKASVTVSFLLRSEEPPKPEKKRKR